MKSVLVIDDDQDIREVISFALESEGYRVLSTDGARKGLAVLERLSAPDLPGLIIVDYLMPDWDGISFIKKLKTDYPEGLGKIPILFSSAMGEIDTTDPQLAGVETLFKPMDLNDLLKVVEKYCGNPE